MRWCWKSHQVLSGFYVDLVEVFPPLHKATAVPNVTQITAVSWEEIENKNGNEALKRNARERARLREAARQKGYGSWADVDEEKASVALVISLPIMQRKA